MKKIFKTFCIFIFALLITQNSATPQPPAVNFPQKATILLKNDRVIQGEILANGDLVQVRSELGVITIARSDIAMVAATLREVYQFKKDNARQTSDDFLKLADWCVTNQLPDEAAVEFDQAIFLAGHPQQADAIRTRKNAALSLFAERHSQVDMVEQENQKYRQWKEKIPAATFTTFKREIFPMLVKNCNGIACHSGNSLNEFRFVANPHNSDIDVAKNLRIVLGYVTPNQPDESPLVLIPIVPHGRTKQIFTRQNLAQYQKLYFWAEQVAKEMDAYYPLDETDRRHRQTQLRSGTAENGNVTTIQHVADNSSVASPNPGNMQKQPPSLAQGLMRNANTTDFTQAQRAEFNFFQQQSIVVPGTTPGGWQGPAQTRPEPQNNRETNMMTLDSTGFFLQHSLLQQMQRDPVDPFDPVLFNRQYHLQRIQEKQQP